jgi:tetratricopeptide (TPR) repeat protein
VHKHRMEWQRVSDALHRALELNPNFATVYHWLSIQKRALGETTQAIELAERGVAVDPLSPALRMNLAFTLFAAARPRDALRALERPGVDENHWAHQVRSLAWLDLHDYARGADALAEWARRKPGASGPALRVADSLRELGGTGAAQARAAALRALNDWEQGPGTTAIDLATIAPIRARLGDFDGAVTALERGLPYTAPDLLADAAFRPLHGRADFQRVLKRAGLAR